MLRTSLLISGLALVASLAGCKDKPAAGGAAASAEKPVAGDKPAAPAGPPAVVGAWKKVPNISGLTADVPTTVVPNGMGGAGGFHSEDLATTITVMATSAEESAKDITKMKADTEEIMFKKWVKAAPTPDGWVLEWTGPKLDANANEVAGATMYSFQIRRTIDSKVYTCYGTVGAAAEFATVEKTCASLRTL